MADEIVYIVPNRNAPRIYASLSGYLQSIAHYGPVLAPSSLPVKLAKAQAAKAKEAAKQAKDQVEQEKKEKTWLEIELVGEDGKTPMPGRRYLIELPDGVKREGLLDQKGRAKIKGLEPGSSCKVTFPDLDQEAWEAG